VAGRICLWRYREPLRDYAGFHLSADPAGCDQLRALLSSMTRARKPEIGTVVLDPVTPLDVAVATNRVGDTRPTSYRRWELLVDPRFPPEHLHFRVAGDGVRTELSPIQAESIMGGVEDIRARRGDYAIGEEEEHQLWFWWQEVS
jgi:hypothetical protein